MPRTKATKPTSVHSSVSTHTSAKGFTKARWAVHQTNSSYQSFYLWVSFLWSLMTLGMVGQRVGVQGQGLPAILDLASLRAIEGMVIQGAVGSDYVGSSVASAGDVNGDGITDLLVGAYNASPLSRSHAGEVYLIYGGRTLSAVLDLKNLTSTQGMVIQGAVAFDRAGISVSKAGDVNGDGLSDLVIGAYSASPVSRGGAGAAYLIYGSRTLPAVLDLNTLTPTQGMVIQGAVAGDGTGSSVSGAGDVNGDGITDVLIGANYASPLSRAQAGGAYLIYGSRLLPAVLDLNTTLTATQGMVIQGAVAGDYAGSSVASSGDVNGDNITDLLVGASNASPLSRSRAGGVYLIYGSRALSALLDLKNLTATQGMVIQGAAAFDNSGSSVSNAGDVNGDGISDLMVGAWQASPVSRGQAGAAYLIYGSRTLAAVLDLNALTATQGMVIQGAGVGDTVGHSVSSGDINGDNITDLTVGTLSTSPLGRRGAGGATLIYGSRTLSAVLDLNALTATQGLVIQGAVAQGQAGWSVSSAGDVDGDGIDDLLVGAWLASPLNRTQAGAAYLIYGKSAVTPTSLMTTNPLSTTPKTTTGTPLSISTPPTTTSLGTTPRTTITTTTVATGGMAGTTSDTVSPATSLSAPSASSSPLTSTGSPMMTSVNPLLLTTGVTTATTATFPNTLSMTKSSLSTGDTTSVSDVTETTPQEAATQAAKNSGVSSTVIGVAAGGGVALLVSLGAAGFFACRKKAGAKRTKPVEMSDSGISLKQPTGVPTSEYAAMPVSALDATDAGVTRANQMSEYASVRSPSEAVSGKKSDYNPITQSNPSSHYSNAVPSVPSDPYAQSQWISIDEANRDIAQAQQKEAHANYADVPNASATNPQAAKESTYEQIDETKKTENEYDRPAKLEM
jgi:hypothetical protein